MVVAPDDMSLSHEFSLLTFNGMFPVTSKKTPLLQVVKEDPGYQALHIKTRQVVDLYLIAPLALLQEVGGNESTVGAARFIEKTTLILHQGRVEMVASRISLKQEILQPIFQYLNPAEMNDETAGFRLGLDWRQRTLLSVTDDLGRADERYRERLALRDLMAVSIRRLPLHDCLDAVRTLHQLQTQPTPYGKEMRALRYRIYETTTLEEVLQQVSRMIACPEAFLETHKIDVLNLLRAKLRTAADKTPENKLSTNREIQYLLRSIERIALLLDEAIFPLYAIEQMIYAQGSTTSQRLLMGATRRLEKMRPFPHPGTLPWIQSEIASYSQHKRDLAARYLGFSMDAVRRSNHTFNDHINGLQFRIWALSNSGVEPHHATDYGRELTELLALLKIAIKKAPFQCQLQYAEDFSTYRGEVSFYAREMQALFYSFPRERSVAVYQKGVVAILQSKPVASQAVLKQCFDYLLLKLHQLSYAGIEATQENSSEATVLIETCFVPLVTRAPLELLDAVIDVHNALDGYLQAANEIDRQYGRNLQYLAGKLQLVVGQR